MNLGLSKIFFYLTIKRITITKQNITYIRVTNRSYTQSPFLFQIMSNTVKDGIQSKNVSNYEKKTNGKEVVDESLIKSENDSMEYRLIQLENGLRAILVSDVSRIVDLNAISSLDVDNSEDEDENTAFEELQNDINSEVDSTTDEDNELKYSVREAEEKMAACALCIGVGSFSDPSDIPGLAHFLEHMVFMGSSKYPQENGFDEFITKHGGSDNGSTDCETTTFYLECNEKYLKEGMNRFAQFFISPLMKREAMTREREIIHSEFEMSMPSDETRREQILASLAPSGHPAGKFLWGNKTTLGTNVDDNVLYESVHAFRRRHYSAHRMTVAVQGRLPLDTLEQYVRDSFSDIPNNGLPSEDFSSFVGSYGAPEQFNKIVWVKPVRDICQIHLTWVLPPLMKEYKSRPIDYIAWLIGHEGEGSLLSYLRKKLWALECEAGNDESGFEFNRIFSLFSISLTLTEEGYKHIDEVVSLVFSYISMLKKNIPDKAIFEELRTICETNFRYKTEIPSASYVEILAESMHLYEPQHYIAGGELYIEYKPQLITEVLNLLTPDRVNVIIYSKNNRESFYDRIEPWFQTKHKIQDIPPEWKEKWVICSEIKEFQVPKPNPYLTTDFSILESLRIYSGFFHWYSHISCLVQFRHGLIKTILILEPKVNPPYPVKIFDNDLLELWYRQDVKFQQPLAYFSFYFISPLLKSDPLNAVLLDVLSAFLETKFTEKLFPANEAGLYCTFFPADLGLFLHFSGYNEKLPMLFDEILRLVYKACNEISDNQNAELFNAIKTGRSRSYYNKFLKPRKLVKMVRLSLLVESFCTSVEYFNLIKYVTLENLHEFARQFFGCVRISGLIQGNISRKKALELCVKFQTVLNCSTLDIEKPQVRVAKLKPGEVFLRLKSFNENDSNSVVVNYYQVGQGSIKTSCMIDLLMMLMDEPLFDNLRTKQQIGYDVHCLLRDTFGVLAFSVTVFFQSDKFTPDEVDERIEAFLKSFLKTLKSMSKKEWEETKSSLISLKSSADLQLQDEVKRNFAEIFSGEYVFDRLQKEVEIIPEISHKELCNWFSDLIASGKNFKKLSVQVVGETRKNVDVTESSENISEKTFQLIPVTSNNEKESMFIKDIGFYKNSREFFPIRNKT